MSVCFSLIVSGYLLSVNSSVMPTALPASIVSRLLDQNVILAYGPALSEIYVCGLFLLYN